MALRDHFPEQSRRRSLRLVVAALVLSMLVAAAGQTAGYEPPELQKGDIDSPAAGDTVISVQGYNLGGRENPNKPARLVSVGPAGERQWTLGRDALNVSWFYDVDPLPDGDLLVVGTFHPNMTRVMRLDGETNAVEWSETLPLWDTHDVTLTADGNLLFANMRNNENGTSRDRVFVYNRTTDEVEWEWLFRNHYENDTAGGVSSGDWTHVNDVDVVAPGLYMLSPRNFDEVIVVNRSTKEIVMRLGGDGNHSVLYEQHNPAYLQSEDGTPTILVADSENNRVVEYACDDGDPDHPLDGDMEPDCDWTQTWEVGVDQLAWPRDADRLPNGNTLITDTHNQRVIEVTPEGEVVWEYYAPWIPYDAERPAHDREAGGPTMRDLNATGSYELTGGSGDHPADRAGRPLTQQVSAAVAGLPGGGAVVWTIDRYEHLAPWVRPFWMPPDAFLFVVLALAVLAGWGAAELVVERRRVRRAVADLLAAVRT